jgi:hypothetical protein
LVSPTCDPPRRPRNGEALRLAVDHADHLKQQRAAVD